VQAPPEEVVGILLGHSDIPKFDIDAGCLRVLRTDTPSPTVITVPMEWCLELRVNGKAYEEAKDKVLTVQGSGGKTYTVTHKVDGRSTCTCPGFIYRKKCKHI
jgi:hypothetical protein